jgi:hypothetical protein
VTYYSGYYSIIPIIPGFPLERGLPGASRVKIGFARDAAG